MRRVNCTKKIIALVLLLALTPYVFAMKQERGFQNRLYCKVSENTAKVYLAPENNSIKCLDYISTLNSYLKKEYDILIQIIKNRNLGDDFEYRNGLYETKKGQFLKLFSQRTMIKKAITNFEEELLMKSKMFLHETLQQRKSELSIQIPTLKQEISTNPYNIKAQKTLDELEHKKDIIENLEIATDMDSFLQIFSEYLTLFPFSQSGK